MEEERRVVWPGAKRHCCTTLSFRSLSVFTSFIGRSFALEVNVFMYSLFFTMINGFFCIFDSQCDDKIEIE